MRTSRRIGLALAAASGLGASVTLGAWVEARAFIVRRLEVPVLPFGSPQIRILHLSDIHQMPYQQRKLAFIRSLSDLQPDLIINTGDNISSPHSIDPLLDALGPLMDLPGVFVFGTNDFFSPRAMNPASYLLHNSAVCADRKALPTALLLDRLTEGGWTYLDNRSTQLEVAGQLIELRGTGDAHHDLDDYDAVAGPIARDPILSIGVTHAPYQRVLNAMTCDGVQMIFAGHTHGGQICLPVNRAVVDNCDLPLDRASGLSVWDAGQRTSWLHVSAGIGTAPSAPIRLFCHPEATLLTLVSRS